MKKLFGFILFSLLFQLVEAQSDSVQKQEYSPDFKFTDGVYLNFAQVKANAPITVSRIISNTGFGDPEFFDVVLSKPEMSYFDQMGMKQTVKVKSIWGYCRNGSLYIRMDDSFNKITYVGNICHFVATITLQNNNYSDPYYYNPYYYYRYGGPSRSYKTSEIRQFIIDFDNGKIYDYTEEALGIILMRDPALYDEYMGLKKRKREQLKFFYMRKFNEKHPLMIPVNQ